MYSLATFICTIGSFISTRGHTMFDGTQVRILILKSRRIELTGIVDGPFLPGSRNDLRFYAFVSNRSHHLRSSQEPRRIKEDK
jgi:hypothetical protein